MKEEFINGRTRIISEMLDNPDEHGIYPTTKCFNQLDELFETLCKQNMKEFAEYVGNRYWFTVDGKWSIINDHTFIPLTTDQLIDEFLNQKK